MPTAILVPSTVLASGSWADASGALALGGDFASCEDQGSWLFLGGFDLSELPAGWVPTGFEVLVRTRYPFAFPVGWFPRMEVALTLDGAAVAGSTQIEELDTALAWTDMLFGGEGDLWGRTWTAEEVEGPGFGVGVRLPLEDEPLEPVIDETRQVDEVALLLTYEVGEMPGERSTVLQGCRVGPESSFGSGGSASISLRSFNVDLNASPEVSLLRTQGYRAPVGTRFEREWAEIALRDGKPCYNELGYPLSMLETPETAVIVASQVYRHTFLPNVRGCSVPKSHVIEKGDGCSVQYEKVTAAVLNALGLTYSRAEIGFDGAGFSRAVDFAPTPTAGANEVQTLTLSGTPTGGDFKLEFKGQVTAAIAHNAAAATVQTALQGLSTIGSGNATVSGSAGGPWTVTFAGTLAGLAQPLITLANNGLTGGTSPSLAIAKTTAGGYTERPLAFIQPGHGKTYLHTTASGALDSANELARLDSATLRLNTGIQPLWAHGTTAIANFKEGEFDFGADLTLQADTAGKGWISQLRAGSKVYLRTKFTGDVIASGEPYFLEILQCCQIQELSPMEDADGVYAVGYNLAAVWDETQGYAAKVILQNRVASY